MMTPFPPLDIDPQLVLAVEPRTKYPSHRFHLPRGARLLLYTDGATDVVNPQGQRLHAEDIRRALETGGPYDGARDMLDRVLAELDSFRAGEELPDDLTLVAVQFEPAAARDEGEVVGATA